ncbi:hypothetical protein LIER_26765 [Lithospermum erythrorhizon]|uniref:Reverse transcriptase domain-containing protein n=1 Tax=Lithospermum erythrorhizon TaxID=34254 RepID=A0AAV3RDL3_LITER
MIEASQEKASGVSLHEVNGANNPCGSRAGILLWCPEGNKIEYSMRFSFKATNKEVEYEVLANGLRLANTLAHPYQDEFSALGWPCEGDPPIANKIQRKSLRYALLDGVLAGDLSKVEIHTVTCRVTYYYELAHEQGLGLNLDLLEEKRAAAVDKMAKYKNKVAAYYNKNVWSRKYLMGKYEPKERIWVSEMANAIFRIEFSPKLNDPVDELSSDTLGADVAGNKDELNLIPTSVNCCIDIGQKGEEVQRKFDLKNVIKKDINVAKQQAYYPRP